MVVFPQPDGPSSEKNSPPATSVDAVDGRDLGEPLNEVNELNLASGHKPDLSVRERSHISHTSPRPGRPVHPG